MKENNTYHEGMDAPNLPNSLRVNPFDTPENYFKDLNTSLMSQVKLELPCKEKEAFDIPAGYFDKLQENITSKISSEKLKEKVQSDGFSQPHNYFSHLQNDISSKISEDNLKSKVTHDGFDIPPSYFNDFNTQIAANIIEDNLKQIVERDGFEVPKTYFDNLTAKITKSIHVDSTLNLPKEATIRSIKNKTSWSKYAVAASLVATLGIGSYFGIQNKNPIQDQNNLTHVSDQEIINYLAQTGNGDDLLYVAKYIDDADIDMLGTNGVIKNEDIEDYLKYTL